MLWVPHNDTSLAINKLSIYTDPKWWGRSALNASQGHKPSYQQAIYQSLSKGDDQPEYKDRVSGLLSRSKQNGVYLSTEVYFVVDIRIGSLSA